MLVQTIHLFSTINRTISLSSVCHQFYFRNIQVRFNEKGIGFPRQRSHLKFSLYNEEQFGFLIANVAYKRLNDNVLFVLMLGQEFFFLT